MQEVQVMKALPNNPHSSDEKEIEQLIKHVKTKIINMQINQMTWNVEVIDPFKKGLPISVFRSWVNNWKDLTYTFGHNFSKNHPYIAI